MLGGYNILTDKMKWVWYRRDALKTFIRVKLDKFVWRVGPKEVARQAASYRGARRNQRRVFRQIALETKRGSHVRASSPR